MLKNFLITFLAMLPIDVVWLFLMKPVYDNWLTPFQRVLNVPAAILVYVFIPFGLFWLVINKNLGSGINAKVLLDAFIYGVCSYAVYDLTNLATLKNWSLQMTVVDIVWGGVLCTITTVATLFILSKI